MRLVRFGGAVSLDGYIAGPNGEYDWIVMDTEMDFAEMMSRYDTFLIGRKTFDAMRKMGTETQEVPGIRNIIFSRTLRAEDFPNIRLESDAERVVRELRGQPGKDIALFGGGELFRNLLEARLVDHVEVAVIPVLLGAGVPLLPSPGPRTKLALRNQRVYEKTGSVLLEYEIVYDS